MIDWEWLLLLGPVAGWIGWRMCSDGYEIREAFAKFQIQNWHSKYSEALLDIELLKSDLAGYMKSVDYERARGDDWFERYRKVVLDNSKPEEPKLKEFEVRYSCHLNFMAMNIIQQAEEYEILNGYASFYIKGEKVAIFKGIISVVQLNT